MKRGVWFYVVLVLGLVIGVVVVGCRPGQGKPGGGAVPRAPDSRINPKVFGPSVELWGEVVRVDGNNAFVNCLTMKGGKVDVAPGLIYVEGIGSEVVAHRDWRGQANPIGIYSYMAENGDLKEIMRFVAEPKEKEK